MKKYLQFLTFVGVCSLSALEGSSIQLPNLFYVKQHWFSLTRAFDIEAETGKIGVVYRKFWSFLPQYEFYTGEEHLEAKAVMRFYPFGAIFDVYRCSTEGEVLMGTVEEQFLKILPTFKILSSTGNPLAVAKVNLLGTKYTVRDPRNDDHVIALLSRPWLRFKDNWKVEVTDREYFEAYGIDPLLFIVIMAFQTDSDCWKHSSSASMSDADVHVHATPTEYEVLLEHIVSEEIARIEQTYPLD